MKPEEPAILQVFADGKLVYSGEKWKEAFWDALKNADYGEIELREHDELRAKAWPMTIKGTTPS